MISVKNIIKTFEDGITADGWLTSRGGIASSTTGATDGSYSMRILPYTRLNLPADTLIFLKHNLSHFIAILLFNC